MAQSNLKWKVSKISPKMSFFPPEFIQQTFLYTEVPYQQSLRATSKQIFTALYVSQVFEN